MDANELNEITYSNTNELTDNPEVTCRDAAGVVYQIVSHETDDREPGSPFVLNIKPID